MQNEYSQTPKIDFQLLEKEISLIRNDPDYYFEEYLGVKLWKKEEEIVISIRDNRKTSVRSCHGSGKTFTVARAAIWFMSAFQPAIVVDTAPTHRQVANQFWRELRAAHKRAKIPLGGELLKTQFNIDEDWYAIGVSTKETTGEDIADKFQGFHGENILFIVDEASGVSESIMEAIDGAMSGGNTVRLVYIGNPTRRTGRFADSFTDSSFNKIHISAFDTPNFTDNGILGVKDLTEEKVNNARVIIPGLAKPDWALDMLKKYGADSDVFRVRVKGQPPQRETDTLIGVDLVENAIDAERDLFGEDEFLGVDPARYGEDFTAIIYRKGNFAKVLKKIQGQNTMEIAGIVKNYLIEYSKAKAHIDIIGLGAGIFDRLQEMPEIANRVYGVNSATPAEDTEHFKNQRAEGWDTTKDWLKTAVLEDHEDWYQLAKPRYKIVSSGQIQLESKEDMKKRKVTSPDVCLAEGTKILLSNGTEENIENIKIGDVVRTPFGSRKVINCGKTGIKQNVFRVLFSNGKELIGTPKHKIFTKKGFKPIDALRMNDIIETSNKVNLFLWKSISFLTERSIGFRQMADIMLETFMSEKVKKIEKKDCCTKRSGNITRKKKFQKDSIFIILTETTTITILKIWNWLTQKHIIADILRLGGSIKNIAQKELSTLPRSENLQANGTNPRRRKNFMLELQKNLGKIKYGKLKNVLCAEKNSKQLSPQGRDFVRRSANSNRDIKVEKILMKKGLVYFVAKRLWHAIAGRMNVAVVYVEQGFEQEDVYNLTIEKDGVYFANGVLVSNCDALAITFMEPSEGGVFEVIKII